MCDKWSRRESKNVKTTNNAKNAKKCSIVFFCEKSPYNAIYAKIRDFDNYISAIFCDFLQFLLRKPR